MIIIESKRKKTETLLKKYPDAILADVTSIGDGAFGGCSSLQSITIPDSVTNIDDRVFTDDDDLPF